MDETEHHRAAEAGGEELSGGPAAAAPPWQTVINSGPATATGGGTAVSGIYNDHSTTILPPDALTAAAQTEAPAGLDNLPFLTGNFVGRAADLDRLDTALAAPGAVLVQAVSGLGGIGKSTLAAEWAATRAHGRRPVRWITADSPAAVQQGLVQLATALRPALGKALTVEAHAEFALQWLATHTGWLIVLDNVSDPGDIAPLINRAPGGRFLITSRLANPWTDPTTLVRLGILTPSESLDLLTLIVTGRGRRDLEGAAELCEELGHLPLAVEQAAAYIAEAGITPRAYLGLLTEYPADMFRDGEEGRAPERTVARIWHLTLDRLTTTPHAGRLLRTLAWYAPNNIPRTLLTSLGTPPEVTGAVRRLVAYSMITATPDTVSVHRLVQAVARTPDPDDPHRGADDIDTARDTATTSLYTAIPDTCDDPAHWPAWRTLIPHLDTLADRLPPDTGTDTLARLLGEAGLFLHGQGLLTRATKHLKRALTDRERALGPDHPETLNARNNLAYAYESAGNLGQAIPLHERNLADFQRVLGPDHPDTLAGRNNLAYAYESAGSLGQAIALYEQNLADSQRVFGPDHAHTFTARNNLASAYQSVGNLDLATPLHEQTLTARERVLGPDHSDTLSSRNNLAYAHQVAGNLGEAIPLHERNLAARERVLGPDHPHTLNSRNNLASAYQSVGNLDRAVTLHERNLADFQRVLGADHPDTLTARNNLAYAHQSAGNLGQAIPLHKRNLAARERVLGPDHPHTLNSRHNLAGAYAAAGELGQAIRFYEQNLADSQRVLGPDHPDTLTAREALAWVYEQQRK
ncbi:tetratricopeptide repeat protein [Streptomyces albipurpureus]|uniref:Tetratricopeptide repeat protein n=1 Tax=Streptomyces albipurpureus TaxID=2897419 RepID=A0ABT0UTT2_9ACTN|nr:tetratricopeptide repeat protein [Streptomyces sp. CWNU-1]MCM2391875.1 tetratricopeptide repeat protein [Streptomyces sp. CWNU-1]